MYVCAGDEDAALGEPSSGLQYSELSFSNEAELVITSLAPTVSIKIPLSVVTQGIYLSASQVDNKPMLMAYVFISSTPMVS